MFRSSTNLFVFLFTIQYIKVFFLCLCRNPSKGATCWLLPVCIKHWWYTRFHSVLHGRTSVTAPELFNNMYKIRTLCDILQRTARRSYLSERIWSNQCHEWAVWSHSARYLYEIETYCGLYLKMTYSFKKSKCIRVLALKMHNINVNIFRMYIFVYWLKKLN